MDRFTDDTLMTFGSYQGTALKNIPAKYLLWLYSQPYSVGTAKIRTYIKENLENLEKRAEQEKK